MARKPTIQDVFLEHFDGLRKHHCFPLPQLKAAESIMNCRTEALGGHEQCCPHGHHRRVQYHSCRHRSCPQCAERAKAQWMERERGRLLPCDHFHAIFTVPHELIPLWRYNRRSFVAALFDASRDTLIQLLAQDRHLGAVPGIVMALHTWGRTLNAHPHVHCLISGGGLTTGGQWRAVKGDFLLPAAVVKRVFRGKLLSRLRHDLDTGRLKAPRGDHPTVDYWLKATAKKEWNVRLQGRYTHGRGVAAYLSRYVRGGPITNTRIKSLGEGQVQFRYHDHRDGRRKLRRVAVERFMEQILWHVPEPGQHTVRHVGLYAHTCRAKRMACREQMGAPMPEVEPKKQTWQAYLEMLGHSDALCCPACGAELIRGFTLPPSRHRIQNSLIRSGSPPKASGSVQQGVEPDPLVPSRRSEVNEGDRHFYLPRCGPVN
ncbi:IS91 family transposase [Alkalilimnicola ehrlichii MLHE-1]|uniref:Putative transposase n=1 Tax=Alkalilimnicola ehrlichii (strain ATCC BAA-1101 / DSM 17681 / MLHE-1) TaxID=187272 RepID=Q0A7P5_ALKEH|nr:putative transposase [Alkalilimnicola ehrlichii MLHE-1]